MKVSINNPYYSIYIQVSGINALFSKTITSFKNVSRIERRGGGRIDIYLKEVTEDTIHYRIRDIRAFAQASPIPGHDGVGSLDSAMVSTPVLD